MENYERKLKIFTGTANQPLTEKICDHLNVEMGQVRLGRFADGEIEVQIKQSVRGDDCYIIQPTCPPVNENIMELAVMMDALSRASAGSITAVIPYFGYARADRKTQPRVPISAKLISNLITSAGANRVMAIDLHVGQIQGFFDIPMDHLQASPAILDYVKTKKYKDLVIVSPDVGGVERARRFAKKLEAPLVITDKRRPKANEAVVYNLIGDVKDKTAFILDDIVDTAGTLCSVVEKIKSEGATEVIAACSHGLLSKDGADRIEKSSLSELIITDTVSHNHGKKFGKKIKILSISHILAEAIKRNHACQSVSEMF